MGNRMNHFGLSGRGEELDELHLVIHRERLDEYKINRPERMVIRFMEPVSDLKISKRASGHIFLIGMSPVTRAGHSF